MHKRLHTALAAAVLSSLPLISSAGVGLVDPTLDSSSSTNASALTVGGSWLVDKVGQSIPWVMPVYGALDECLRIDVVAVDRPENDLEAVLIGPGGEVYRNDNRKAGDLRPLIKVQTVTQGWYTLQIASASGAVDPGTDGSNFTVKIGRYTPSTNPNCASPTPAL